MRGSSRERVRMEEGDWGKKEEKRVNETLVKEETGIRVDEGHGR